MSSIGKIFVVLNLVLAAVFVGWAANAASLSGDWKKKYEDQVTLYREDTSSRDDECEDTDLTCRGEVCRDRSDNCGDEGEECCTTGRESPTGATRPRSAMRLRCDRWPSTAASTAGQYPCACRRPRYQVANRSR